ncbi:MAG TPA: hypothetical protein VHB79_22245 [Polyangiaceae bacterium]|nr:hypothetical protein [Polyangiaceae bacterium]
MASPARLVFAWLLALGTLCPALARAEGPQQLSIAAAGACPSAEDVGQELQELMPDATLSISPDVVDSDVIVSDRGAGFTVKVRGQRKRFRNTERDCLERARHVAVFAVLVIDPLHVPVNAVNDAEEEPEPEKPPEPPPPPLPRPKPAPVRTTYFDFALGPLAQVALKTDASGGTQAGGLGLRLRYGGSFGITLGLAGLLPTSLHFAQADARATWAPMDLSLAFAQRVSSWEVELDLGVAPALLLVEGQALDATQQAVRLEVGGRVGAQVRYWASDHAGIWGGMFVTYFPQPYALQVEGIGTVGQTPAAWVGGSLGAIIRL